MKDYFTAKNSFAAEVTFKVLTSYFLDFMKIRYLRLFWRN